MCGSLPDITLKEGEGKTLVYRPLTLAGKELQNKLRPCVENQKKILKIEQERTVYKEQGLSASPVGEEWKELQREMTALRQKLDQQINETDALSPEERQIIRLRYLCGMKWEEITRTLYLTREPVFVRHRAALNKLAAGWGSIEECSIYSQ